MLVFFRRQKLQHIFFAKKEMKKKIDIKSGEVSGWLEMICTQYIYTRIYIDKFMYIHIHIRRYIFIYT